MKYRTDLILGEAFCIFIFFYSPDFGLGIFYGCIFIFDGVTVKTEDKQLLFFIRLYDWPIAQISQQLSKSFPLSYFRLRIWKEPLITDT